MLPAAGRRLGQRSKWGARMWRKRFFPVFVGLLVVPIVGILIVGVSTKGFAFTPRWSVVFAIWILAVSTLGLHILATAQFDSTARESLDSAKGITEQTRKSAVDRADTVRDAGGDPRAQPLEGSSRPGRPRHPSSGRPSRLRYP